MKNNPPDLINVAIEELVRTTCELPAFRTLDEMAAWIRREVNEDIFATVRSRMTFEDGARLAGLLDVGGLEGKSGLNRLKKPAKRPSWSHPKEQHKQLQWVDGLGGADEWREGIAPGKIADFAAEAGALDAAELRDYETGKRTALPACLVHTARRRARDNLAEMFCKRVAAKLKNAKDELEEIRKPQALVERMIGTYRTVLERIDPADLVPRGPDGAPASFPAGKKARRKAARAPAAKRAVALAPAQKAVQTSGSFAVEFAGIEAVAARHGNDHEVLVARFHKRDRAPMPDWVGTPEFAAVSEDRRVLDALAHARAHQSATREYLSELYEGEPLDLGFASQNWQRAVRDRKRPGMLDRRCFEALVFTYLAEHLRTGDVAVTGSDTFANWLDQLPDWGSAGRSWRSCARRLGCRTRPQGSPRPCASGWRARRRRWIAEAEGPLRPVCPDHLRGRHHHDVRRGRAAYFQVSAHELSAITNRHLSVDRTNGAITDVVNAFMRLDLVKAWGDGTCVAADGTRMDTFIDNLLAETSIAIRDGTLASPLLLRRLGSNSQRHQIYRAFREVGLAVATVHCCGSSRIRRCAAG
ncbi:Tn3 family transposase [Streptomyces celluloflavus]|uniref:Tn3 family transposase n=1 Tax=Streptomyces celluloflavus TaxID=58344 RepID=UPI0036554DA0